MLMPSNDIVNIYIYIYIEDMHRRFMASHLSDIASWTLLDKGHFNGCRRHSSLDNSI